METLPEPQDQIKSLLSWFMSDEDVACYSDVACALETLKKGELCWQAAVSIGVHALKLGVIGKTDEEKALAENLVGRALEPMEALYESLTQQPSQQPLTDEQARMLFHLRFGLGFLLLAKGKRETAKAFLHDMAATKLSWHRGGSMWGGDIVPYTDDMGSGKEVTALAMSLLYPQVEDYDEALYLIGQAVDTPRRGDAPLVLADDLLDRWAAKCERIEQQEGAGQLDAWNEWTSLLYRAAEVLSVCQHVDTSGAPPGECQQGSAQFLAYKLGQLAARFAAKNAPLWHDYMEESDEPTSADFAIDALLCECEVCTDWQTARDRYLTGWRRTPCYEGASPEEIGPHMDLYWAMRIGFAEKMLESTQALVPARPAGAATDLPPDLQTIKDMVGYAIVRLMKQERVMEERFPPTEQELHLFLEERLGRVWDNLPSDVTDALVSAEYGYRAGWQSGIPTRAVVEDLHDAVQACFQAYFVDRFIAYLNEGRLSSTPLSFGRWRGQWQEREFQADNPGSVSLGVWGSVLEAVADATLTGTENLQVSAFMSLSWPNLGADAVRQLAASLRRVQHLRNPAVHRQWPPRPHHKEKTGLDDIRKLVLDIDGDGSSSIIVQIYRLLAPSKQS